MECFLVSIEKLKSGDRIAMYMLMEKHFEGITWDGFQSDLESKNWVILLKDETSHTLKGFSTLLLCQKSFLEEQINVVYSGDTIVDPSAWSSTSLPRSWIAAINFLRQNDPNKKLYWLLICSGFRTYRFLPTFWQDFYPRYDEITPVDIKNLMGSLAQQFYGNSYQEETGIVHFPNPQVLRKGLIEIPSGRENNPHIQFFKEKNPGYDQGDELVCLTEVCFDNLTRAGKRMWESESSLSWESVDNYYII